MQPHVTVLTPEGICCIQCGTLLLAAKDGQMDVADVLIELEVVCDCGFHFLLDMRDGALDEKG